MSTPAGIVTGLRTEARIARKGADAIVACRGPGADRAAEAARELIDMGVAGLVSFGFAAGLVAEARPGLVVIPARIVSETGHVATDLLWRERLLARLSAHLDCTDAPLAAVAQPLLTYLDKASCWAQTQAAAADMESAAIAAAARDARLPFVAIRAVTDPLDFPLPSAALLAVDARGRVRPFRLLRALWRNPSQIRALRELSGHAAKAGAALRAALALAGADLALHGPDARFRSKAGDAASPSRQPHAGR